MPWGVSAWACCSSTMPRCVESTPTPAPSPSGTISPWQQHGPHVFCDWFWVEWSSVGYDVFLLSTNCPLDQILTSVSIPPSAALVPTAPMFLETISASVSRDMKPPTRPRPLMRTTPVKVSSHAICWMTSAYVQGKGDWGTWSRSPTSQCHFSVPTPWANETWGGELYRRNAEGVRNQVLVQSNHLCIIIPQLATK